MLSRGMKFWYTAAFVLLMMVIQIMRPVKDAMAIQAGLKNLPVLMFIAFILILVLSSILYKASGKYGYIILILFLVTSLLALPFQPVKTGAAIIYISFSATGLLILTQFWRIVNERIDTIRAKEMFAHIVAYGTLGSIVGSFTFLSLSWLTHESMFLYAIIILVFMAFISLLIAGSYINSESNNQVNSQNVKKTKTKYGSFLILYSLIATFLYYQQLEIVNQYSATFLPSRIFAIRDITISLLTLVVHNLIIKNEIKVENYIPIVPKATAWLFIVILFQPSLLPVLMSVVIFRAGNFTITKPSRELYYKLHPKLNKYKGFLDAAVYRGGDIIGATYFGLLTYLELNHATKTVLILPLVLLWYYSSKKVSGVLKVKS